MEMEKQRFHLGMRLAGAVVDALTQSMVGLAVDGGGYVVMGWDEFLGSEYVA